MRLRLAWPFHTPFWITCHPPHSSNWGCALGTVTHLCGDTEGEERPRLGTNLLDLELGWNPRCDGQGAPGSLTEGASYWLCVLTKPLLVWNIHILSVIGYYFGRYKAENKNWGGTGELERPCRSTSQCPCETVLHRLSPHSSWQAVSTHP